MAEIVPTTQQASVFDPASLSNIAASKALTKEQKIAEMARQFETAILRPLISSALESNFEGCVKKSSSASGYTKLATDLLSDSLTQNTSFGISTVLQAQLTTKAKKE